MSETEVVEKLKKALIPKYAYWIILIALIVAGMYLTAMYFWNLHKGGKKEAKKK